MYLETQVKFMKPKTNGIIHYVEESFRGTSSFVIIMIDDNGKESEWISNGCQFVENTPENIKRLIEVYDCKSYIDELLTSDNIKDSELTNGEGMYEGCTSLTQPGDYPNLTKGISMYYGCTSLTQPGEYPNLINGYFMYSKCTLLTQPGVYPNLTNGYGMYWACTSLTQPGDYPNLTNGDGMYLGCTSLTHDTNQICIVIYYSTISLLIGLLFYYFVL